MKKELELQEKIERRLEMIHAHTKRGNTIREVIKEFGVCRDTYYHWYHQYVEKGIFPIYIYVQSERTIYTKIKIEVI